MSTFSSTLRPIIAVLAQLGYHLYMSKHNHHLAAEPTEPLQIASDQRGQIANLGVLLVLTIVLFVVAVGFGAWAFASRQDYKNNSDQKSAVAVTVAKQEEDSVKDKAFLEQQKSPLRTYTGPQNYGSIRFDYPKTWSGYVDDSGSGSTPLDGYFYPSIVPSITDKASVFALRVQVLPQSYTSSLQSISSQQQAGKLGVNAYALPKVPNAVGIKVSGTFSSGTSGVMVMLPLRNQTIQISTQGANFVQDFEQIVLPSMSFAP